MTPETLHLWVRRDAVDHGRRAGITSVEPERIRELDRVVRGQRRANEILKAASAFFARELDPHWPTRWSSIPEPQGRWGVEPICRLSPVAPSSYYATIGRPVSVRRQRDTGLQVAIRRVWDEQRQEYGAEKVRAPLQPEGRAEL